MYMEKMHTEGTKYVPHMYLINMQKYSLVINFWECMSYTTLVSPGDFTTF